MFKKEAIFYLNPRLTEILRNLVYPELKSLNSIKLVFYFSKFFSEILLSGIKNIPLQTRPNLGVCQTLGCVEKPY